MKAATKSKARIVRAFVDKVGAVSVQMMIGERPLTEKQMSKVKRLVAQMGSEVYGRQVLVNLKTNKLEIVLRKNEI